MRDIIVRDIWITTGTVTIAESEGIEPNVVEPRFYEKMTETRFRNAVSRKIGTQNFIVTNFSSTKEKRFASLEEFYMNSKPYID